MHNAASSYTEHPTCTLILHICSYLQLLTYIHSSILLLLLLQCTIIFNQYQNQYILKGAPIAQLGERRTLDRKVADSILTRGALLCSSARHFVPIA